MSLKALTAKVERLQQKIAPHPLIIDCTGAREEMLAMLEAQMSPEEREEMERNPYVPSAEELTRAEEFSAFLEWDIQRIEQQCNVRFVSYDD